MLLQLLLQLENKTCACVFATACQSLQCVTRVCIYSVSVCVYLQCVCVTHVCVCVCVCVCVRERERDILSHTHTHTNTHTHTHTHTHTRNLINGLFQLRACMISPLSRDIRASMCQCISAIYVHMN